MRIFFKKYENFRDFRGLVSFKIQLKLNVQKSIKLKDSSPSRKANGKPIGFERKPSHIAYDGVKPIKKSNTISIKEEQKKETGTFKK